MMDFPPHTALFFSLAAPFLGPLFFWATRKKASLIIAIDGYVLVTISGLVTLHILPHTFHEVGFVALLIFAASFILPSLIERLRGRIAHTAHSFSVALALLGIALHTFSDGMALASSATEHGFHGNVLPLAVVLHRIPDGIMIWWLTRPQSGTAVALRTLALMAVCTLAGFYVGESVFSKLSPFAIGVFEAMVGGSLMHVLLHNPMPAHAGHKPKVEIFSFTTFSGIFCGILTTAFILHHDMKTLQLVLALVVLSTLCFFLLVRRFTTGHAHPHPH